MFVTKHQFYVFIACIAFGGMGGVLFSIFQTIKFCIKNKLVKATFDVFVFLILAGGYVLYSHLLNFPNIRIYMMAGVFVGIVLYFKSFHIILAKYLKKLYNIIVKNLKRKKKEKHERIKVKKSNSRNNGRSSSSRGRVAFNHGLSINSYSGDEKSH